MNELQREKNLEEFGIAMCPRCGSVDLDWNHCDGESYVWCNTCQDDVT